MILRYQERQTRRWQERRASNPQPPVLETGALPIELRSFAAGPAPGPLAVIPNPVFIAYWRSLAYSMILATTPAPTVRPPSRIAKRRPSSMAIGQCSSTLIDTLSPGITISVPSGSAT